MAMARWPDSTAPSGWPDLDRTPVLAEARVGLADPLGCQPFEDVIAERLRNGDGALARLHRPLGLARSRSHAGTRRGSRRPGRSAGLPALRGRDRRAPAQWRWRAGPTPPPARAGPISIARRYSPRLA